MSRTRAALRLIEASAMILLLPLTVEARVSDFFDDSSDLQILLLHTSFRVVAISAGSLFVFLGYRLFLAGIFNVAGELNAVFANRSLTLKRGAPGTFFALFGVIVVCVALFRGVDINTRSGLDPAITAIVSKAVAGTPLEPTERVALGQWLEANKARSFSERKLGIGKNPLPSPSREKRG